jgi:protocatechuate 3,4-dioxygenase beta subunit
MKFGGTGSANLKADDEGRVVLVLPPEPKYFKVQIEHPGYGPYWAQWDQHGRVQEIPAELTAELDAGWTVGGIVVDGAGKPIEGVEVSVSSIRFKKRPGDLDALHVGTDLKTAADGSWKYACVPASMKDLVVAFNHERFMPERPSLSRSKHEIPADGKPKQRIELKPGITMTGTVTDEAGRPLAGALVRAKFWNHMREDRTNDQGEYQLVGCEPRMTRIVVSAAGKALEMKSVHVDPQMEPVDFSLKPGGHLRVVALDEQGKPIPKTRIFFQRWRGHIEYFEFDHVYDYADENGVWEWNEAPHDEIKADICRPGGMQLLEQSLVARDEEYVFRPPPALVIRGQVVDAKTKKPIEKFRVVPGRLWDNGQTFWDINEGHDATGGQYESRRNRGELAHYVRVEADGYQAGVSRAIKSDEGDVTVDFELKPAANITATIVTRDGAPAEGAKVALGVAGSQIMLQNGDIDDSQTYATRLVSDKEGRVSFPQPEAAFQLVITHAAGFAHVKSAEAPMPDRIELTPFARVEGTFRVGPKPRPDVSLELYMNAMQSHGQNEPNIFSRHLTTTGHGGEFLFERVFPGKGRLGRNIVYMARDGATEVTSSKRVTLELAPGETARVDLGGDGHPVVGRLEPPANFQEKVPWSFVTVRVGVDVPTLPQPPAPAEVRNDIQRYQAWWKEWQLTAEGQRWKELNDANERLRDASAYFTASVDRDGTFRIDDVPPGSYVLSAGFDHQHPGAGQIQNHRFSVPDGSDLPSDEAIDLGVLPLER